MGTATRANTPEGIPLIKTEVTKNNSKKNIIGIIELRKGVLFLIIITRNRTVLKTMRGVLNADSKASCLL
jgi:hypothetical protein